MRKYAAATALALITMLTLAVSASLTPANAAWAAVWCADPTLLAHRSGNSVPLAVEGCCLKQCSMEAWRLIRHGQVQEAEKKSPACNAKCVNAFEATRR
jgi:hypothetical protein